MKQTLLSLAFVLGFVFSLGAWTEDYEAAVAQARRENKPLLLDFTGSDWCVWCHRLEAEVFSQPAFKNGAPQKYVLVKLDFPRAKPQTEAVRRRNQDLAARYGVEGYPTILLVDAQGRVFGRTGYQAGGAEAYMSHLASFEQGLADFRAREAALPPGAGGAAGAARARALDALWAFAQPRGLGDFVENLGAQIRQADPQDQTGLVRKYSVRTELDALLASLTQDSDYRALLGSLVAFEGRAQGFDDLLQEIVYYRAVTHASLLREPALAKPLFERARALGPQSAFGQAAARALQQLP